MGVRILIPILVVAMFGVNAQQPNVPPEYLDHARRVQGDHLNFCVLQDSVLSELNEAVARLLAEVLLLDSSIYEISVPTEVQPLGYRIPFSQDQVFFLLNNECDVFMGYLYGAGTFPEWLTASIEYLHTGFVLLTRNPEVTALGNIPFGGRIGTQLGSGPNSRLTTLMNNMPENQRWRRVPYPDNEILLQRLADGTVDAAFVWEPAYHVFGDQSLHEVPDTAPVQPSSASFVAAIIAGDGFLQSSLDAAINAVIEDGSLQDLIDDLGVPASATPN